MPRVPMNPPPGAPAARKKKKNKQLQMFSLEVWKLARALSAPYPQGANKKSWGDGVLARKKGWCYEDIRS